MTEIERCYESIKKDLDIVKEYTDKMPFGSRVYYRILNDITKLFIKIKYYSRKHKEIPINLESATFDRYTRTGVMVFSFNEEIQQLEGKRLKLVVVE